MCVFPDKRNTLEVQNIPLLFIPSKAIMKKPSDKVWFADSCRQAARRKCLLFNQIMKDGSTAGKVKFQKAWCNYISAEKIARINYNRKLKEHSRDSNPTSKKEWQIIHSLNGRSSQKENHQVCITVKDKKEVFCKICPHPQKGN